MKKVGGSRPIIAAALSILVFGCVNGDDIDADPAASEQFIEAGWSELGAKLVGPKGEDVGRVAFRQGENGVVIRIRVARLSPGWHGVHLHSVGDCADGADGFKASGPHFNPDGRSHGLAHDEGPERGDLPNIFAATTGRAVAEFFKPGVSLRPSEQGAALNGPFPLLDDDGFAVIVHAAPDDHQSQPIGGAGARVACAAIGG